MKIRNMIGILAILIALACLVLPAAAADNATEDAATSFYNHGVLVLGSNDYAGAISLFDQALASNTTLISKSDTLAYIYQAKAYAQIQLGNYTDALSTINEGLASDGKDAKLWNNKGYALYSLGQYQQALDAYNTAIQYEQNYTNALINKGDTLQKLNRYQDAIDSYNAALVASPGNAAATEGLAKAQKAAQSVIAITPVLVIEIVVVIFIVAGLVYALKFRKPEEKKPEPKKAKGKK